MEVIKASTHRHYNLVFQLIRWINAIGLIVINIFYLSNEENMTINNNSNSKTSHFIGLGSAGSTIAEYIFNKGIQAKYTIIRESKPQNLNSAINFIEYSPKCDITQLRDMKFRIFNPKLNQEIPKSILNVFTKDENFILISGLSGATGTSLTKELAKWLDTRNKSFLFFGTLPFKFEGKQRISIASDFVKTIQTKSNFHFLNLEMIREKYGNLPMNEVFERANEEMFLKIYNSLC